MRSHDGAKQHRERAHLRTSAGEIAISVTMRKDDNCMRAIRNADLAGSLGLFPITGTAAFGAGEANQTDRAHSAPEKSAHTPRKPESQSDGAGHTEHPRDKHIAAFVGAHISRVENAQHVDQLGESLHGQSREKANRNTYEPKDQPDFEHRGAMA